MKNNYKELAEQFLEDYNLDHGNGYVDVTNKEVEITVEAPYHWTNTLTINIIDLPNEAAFIDAIKEEFVIMVNEIDVDDYFNELWHGGFNEYTPSEFLRMLSDDKRFYLELAVHFAK